ncbi:hypothetical protein GCM10007916_33930 [Psychromonas marina]|uniref:Uncharacterized protein n=1 Tax=Psychromonas marina TaxID=88364 RepID=A0ABQ6E540_9GAMM|nr:hypothetical protein GCM10007916_33930 [Psychromonas marina]
MYLKSPYILNACDQEDATLEILKDVKVQNNKTGINLTVYSKRMSQSLSIKRSCNDNKTESEKK